MYTELERKYHSIKNGVCQFIMTIFVDKEEDVPEPKENWMPGSVCQISNPHKYLTLNHEGEWE